MDSTNPVFNTTYGQWVNPSNLEPYVGSAIQVSMETKHWLVRSMYNEPGISFGLAHFSGDLTWDGQLAMVASDTIVLIPGDIVTVVSTTSIGFQSTGIRDFNHIVTVDNVLNSQFCSVPGGLGLCIPSTVVLSLPWNTTVKGDVIQTAIRRGAGGGLLWRPGAGSIDKTTVTIHRNY